MKRSRRDKVSVIMPIGPNRDWLDSAIASVLSQDFESFNLFCVIDGTDSHLVSHLSRYAKTQVLSTSTSLGPAAARNYGIHRSDSEYIALLDADDVWPSDHLTKLIDYLDTNPEVVAAASQALIADESGQGRSLLHKRSGSIRNRLLIRNYIANSACVFRRSVGERYGFYRDDVRVCEDYDLWLRIAQGGDMHVLRDTSPIQYRRGVRGVSREPISSVSKARVAEARKALSRTLGIPEFAAQVIQATWIAFLFVKRIISSKITGLSSLLK